MKSVRSHLQPSLPLLVALALFTLGSVGCAGLAAIMPVEHRDVRAALQTNNTALLKDICSGKRRVRYSGDRRTACNHLKQAAATKGTCEDALARYKSVRKSQALVNSFAKEFAKCGHWDAIFEHLAHYGNRMQQPALLSLEDSGAPLKAKYVQYLSTHKGPRFFAMGGATAHYALQHIGNWLVKKGHTDLCPQVAAAATGANPVAQAWVLPYLKTTKCTQGAPIAANLLLANNANHRKWACQALAVIGGKRDAKKMAILANTDPYSVVREVRRNGRIWATKEYPVRAACRQAVGKVKLRTM